ncbi:MAG: DUF2380 domain-containing protein [Xanthobacteraceae bacterium]
MPKRGDCGEIGAGRGHRRPDVADALRHVFAGLAAAMLVLAAPSRAEDPTAAQIPIAVADFDYTDASGEADNQRAEHAARLEIFARMIRSDLAGSGKYRVVALACAPAPCSAGRIQPAMLLEDARRAGARLLLYGGIQKMSTLIQFAKSQVVDVDADKLVFDRLITFRGDSDEAWRRAEQFLVGELVSANGPH